MVGLRTLGDVGSVVRRSVTSLVLLASPGPVSEVVPVVRRRVRSAVLVDAENVVLGLGAIDRRAMEIFRDHPRRWLDWLMRLPYGGTDESVRRDALTRKSFINPAGQSGMRSGLVSAGFHVVDCPVPSSGSKKNSADIHLVVAAMELLLQPTRYDEVIIVASDSDYVPLLHSLRAHDRRTVVVAGGPSSEALACSCDHFIDAHHFADALLAAEGLNLPAVASRSAGRVSVASTAGAARGPRPPVGSAGAVENGVPGSAATVKTTAKQAAVKKAAIKGTPSGKAATKTTPVKNTTLKGATAGQSVAKKASSTAMTADGTMSASTSGRSVPAKATGQAVAKAVARSATEAILEPATPTECQARAKVIQIIQEAVSQSSKPLTLSALGKRVRPALAGAGELPTKGGWLKALLKQLEPDLQGVALSEAEQGFVYAPGRHQPPGTP